MMRLVSFQEGTGGFALSFCHVKKQQECSHSTSQGERVHQGIKLAGTLILDFQSLNCKK